MNSKVKKKALEEFILAEDKKQVSSINNFLFLGSP
mgnify:CR=1 FL=1